MLQSLYLSRRSRQLGRVSFAARTKSHGNRYHMEHNNNYMGHDNVLIYVIEHDIVATLDILYEHSKTGKLSDVLNI